MFWYGFRKMGNRQINFYKTKTHLLMKSSVSSFAKFLRVFTLSLVAIVTFSSFTMANPSGEKAIQKAKSAVANAKPNDWKVLMKSAKKCISQDANLEEAGQWLEKSLSIYLDASNLEVQGDYYMAINLPKKALTSYIKAILVGKQLDVDFQVGDLQQKVNTAKKLTK